MPATGWRPIWPASPARRPAPPLLGLGGWHSIAIESPDGHLFLSAPTAETLLLALREPTLPMARLGLLAERAGRAARGWLERVR
jgi:hypothetical protein